MLVDVRPAPAATGKSRALSKVTKTKLLLALFDSLRLCGLRHLTRAAMFLAKNTGWMNSTSSASSTPASTTAETCVSTPLHARHTVCQLWSPSWSDVVVKPSQKCPSLSSPAPSPPRAVPQCMIGPVSATTWKPPVLPAKKEHGPCKEEENK